MPLKLENYIILILVGFIHNIISAAGTARIALEKALSGWFCAVMGQWN
jgi:hypothetical protein